MIKTISPYSDFVLENIVLKDGNGMEVDIDKVQSYTLRLGTCNTNETNWLLLTQDRLVNGKVHIDKIEMTKINSGQFLLKMFLVVPDTAYPDRVKTTEWTETLDYYYDYNGDVDETFIKISTSNIVAIQNQLLYKSDVGHKHVMSDITDLGFKTINGHSVVGDGNIIIQGTDASGNVYDDTYVRGLITNLSETKADKTQIPSLDAYVKTADASAMFQQKGEYLTEHQSLTDYAKKTEIPTKTSDLTNDSGYLTSHQDLSGYAKSVDVPSHTSQLYNDSGYLTSHQDLSEYAKKSEVPSQVTLTSYLKTADASAMFQQKGDYLTEHQDISGKADKGDVYTKTESDGKYQPKGSYLTQHQDLTNYATKSWVNGKGYLTSHQDISGKANKSEVYTKNDVYTKSDVYTKAESDGKFQPKGSYLTSHQDISGKANKSEVYSQSQSDAKFQPKGNYATKTEVPTKVSQLENDKGYLTQAKIEEIQNLSEYAKKTELPKRVSQLVNDLGYLTQHQDLSLYARKSEIPESVSLEGYIKSTDADKKYQPKGNYALKSEIPTVPTKVSQLMNDKGYLTEHQSLEGYARTSQLPKYTSQLVNNSGYLTQHQDLSAYAKKTDLPSEVNLDIYETTAHAEETYQPKGEYLTEHQSVKTINGHSILGEGNLNVYDDIDFSPYAKKTDIPTKITDLVNNSPFIVIEDVLERGYVTSDWVEEQGYLTEHQSLDGKANVGDSYLKSESDAKYQLKGNYLTTHQDISGKADKDDVYTKIDCDGLYQPKGNYLTEHQSLEGKADVGVSYTKEESDASYQPKGAYLTQHQDISGKADKDEIPTRLSQLVNDCDFINQHVDISGKANVGDSYLKSESDAKYQLKGNYLTTHQDISGKANVGDSYLKSESDLLWAGKGDVYTKTESDYRFQPKGNYLTQHQDLSSYAKKTDIPTSVSQLANDSSYATTYWVLAKNYLTEHQPLKTINGESVVGEGNIEINKADGIYMDIELEGELEYDVIPYRGGIFLYKNIPTYTQQHIKDDNTEETVTSGADIQFFITGDGFTINQDTGDIYVTQGGDYLRTAVVTVRFKANGKIARKSCTIKQEGLNFDPAVIDAMGVGIMDINNRLYASVEAWKQCGSPVPLGIAVSDGQHRICVGFTNVHGCLTDGWGSVFYTSYFGGAYTKSDFVASTNIEQTALGDYKGKFNTEELKGLINSSDGRFTISPYSVPDVCYNTIAPNGKNCYLPSLGELDLWYNNIDNVDILLDGLGGQTDVNGNTIFTMKADRTTQSNASYGNSYWSSTQGLNEEYSTLMYQWAKCFYNGTNEYISRQGGRKLIRPFIPLT